MAAGSRGRHSRRRRRVYGFEEKEVGLKLSEPRDVAGDESFFF